MSHGYIQWNGTTACMDINCSCGKLTHVCDETFMYYVQCPYCNAVYELDSKIEFKLVAPAEVGSLSMKPHIGLRSGHPEDDDL